MKNGSLVKSQGAQSAPEWLQTLIGASPDIILGVRYLLAKGIHSKFVYSTKQFYMFPVMGSNWHKYKISKYGYRTIAKASFRQIIAGNARAGLLEIVKSLGKTAILTAIINFSFNFYENNWKIDGAMLLDTVIDTSIGLASYGLSAGVMALAVAGLAFAGVAVPGVIVVIGMIGLSIFFEWAIRQITGYNS